MGERVRLCDVCKQPLSAHQTGAGVPICPGIYAPGFRSTLNDEITALQQRVKQLEEGLEPFAKEFDRRDHLKPGPDIDQWNIGGSALTYGDLRKARSLLSDKGED